MISKNTGIGRSCVLSHGAECNHEFIRFTRDFIGGKINLDRVAQRSGA